MKKKFFFAAVALVMSAATAVGYKAYSDSQIFMSFNIEALTRNETGNVVCKCNEAFLGNKKCLASNNDSTCATGDNIYCQSYNSNCGGKNETFN